MPDLPEPLFGRDEPEPEPEPAPDGWLRAPDQPQQDGPDLPNAMFTGRDVTPFQADEHDLDPTALGGPDTAPELDAQPDASADNVLEYRPVLEPVEDDESEELYDGGGDPVTDSLPPDQTDDTGDDLARPDPLSPAGGRVPPGASCGADLGR